MLTPIPDILDELRDGKMIVLIDDEDRENEGDLVVAAEKITPEIVNFMLREARGYMCLSLAGDDCERLDLHPQAAVNTSVRATPFTVTIDGHPKHGFTTGVSAHERAKAIQLAIDPTTTPSDFVRPGHINPLRARDGGVLVRAGQTEGSVDLCRLAGLQPAAAIIEVMREDGYMARVPDLLVLCEKHDLKMCSVAQIIEHRLAQESLVTRLDPQEGRPLHTPFGEFRLHAFGSVVDALPHLAIVAGDVTTDEPTLVRMHRRNLLGDVFEDTDATPEGATRSQLVESMRRIQEEGRGAIVYLRPSDETHDEATDPDTPTLSGPHREIGVGCQILRDLGLSKLRLLTDHPRDLPDLDAYGLEVVEQIPLMQHTAGTKASNA